jgi:hypothetical protein
LPVHPRQKHPHAAVYIVTGLLPVFPTITFLEVEQALNVTPTVVLLKLERASITVILPFLTNARCARIATQQACKHELQFNSILQYCNRLLEPSTLHNKPGARPKARA